MAQVIICIKIKLKLKCLWEGFDYNSTGIRIRPSRSTSLVRTMDMSPI